MWQSTLEGRLLRLRPLKDDDYDSLYAVGSDPAIWEQHPENDRYKPEKFSRYFRGGIESKGAFAVLERATGRVIGSSRFTRHDPKGSSVEIGYTFLARDYWGKGHNRELKDLMLAHAFKFVDRAHFYIGETNHRSRRAVEKLGPILARTEVKSLPEGNTYTVVIYEIEKAAWQQRKLRLGLQGDFFQTPLMTPRLVLEPITAGHAEEMWRLFDDPELHRFVPYEPLTLEKQRERCARWEARRSPDGQELWLNWAGRDKGTNEVVAHFQAGVKADAPASVGYLVARPFQRKGYAFDGLKAVFTYLRDDLGVREVKAWVDTRNVASHRLAQKLGMVNVETIKDADFFKGATSDEFVFARSLRRAGP